MPSPTFYHVSNKNRFGTIERIIQGKKYYKENVQQDQDLKLIVLLLKEPQTLASSIMDLSFWKLHLEKQILQTVLFLNI